LRPHELGAPFSELEGLPQDRLTVAQEDLLFRVLMRLGAFDRIHETRSMWEDWEALRAAGYVYDPEKEPYGQDIYGKWSCYSY